ncbi:heme-binding protein [Undibacterium sp. TS12]|uniref:heme-binding protein n=1 Tax=Undibacterium sp. TS12 TaxID=2908202 RepID=UPI001F4C9857|nr:heme-binding protein [Undibacterium sp. TS12]MCH8619829.1 heme-binding protein [Undibacterium sp. TS12]
MTLYSPRRVAAPGNLSSSPLGPLAELEGSWSGRGFNLIAVPNKQHNAAFRLMLNATAERIQFNAIGGPVPNRGSAQGDIDIFGLTYLQQVNDAPTMEGLHIEPGIWLNVPATTDPKAGPSIVRQSTIPHGDSLLAQGTSLVVAGGPHISPVSSKPTGPGMAHAPLGYLDPYLHSNLPPGMKQSYVADMNEALRDAIHGQNIISTTVLSVASIPVGGIVNIPFVTVNANATKLEAIFWIETVERPDGTQFMQLQYTQTVILNFLNIDWPHISVGTLIRT